MSERYLPQDKKCDFCQNRIGDHEQYQLWRCLDKISESFIRVRKAYQAFEKILDNIPQRSLT